MKAGAVLFVLALLGGAAAGVLLVLPVHAEAAGAAEEIEKAPDIATAWSNAGAWPGPTSEEAARLNAALSAFAPPTSALPLPAGMSSLGKGAYEGVVAAGDVQALLAWVASRPESVTLVEVTTVGVSRGPGMASCRVVLGERVRR